MDEECSVDMRVSDLTPEDTEDGVRKVENWLRSKHGGLFRAILKNGSDNELKIQCYCNATFAVGCNEQQYLKSYFTTHKQNCIVMSELSIASSCRKRSVEAFQDGLSPV